MKKQIQLKKTNHSSPFTSPFSFLIPFFLSAFCFFPFASYAQQSIYQLPNNSFETWYLETSNERSIVPTNFNSFFSASGQMATYAADKRCDSSRDVRSEAAGNFSLHLFSTIVLGIRANGNVTTGRINAGSIVANSADNYNYSDYATTPPKYYQEITGTPDSLRFWVKYLPGREQTPNITDKGRIRVYIHGTSECRDASQYPTGMSESQLYFGKAMKEFYKEDGEWHCYTVPFEYTGTNNQKNANGNYYVLVSLTTNSAPGGGADNPDKVWFDDIEFIYNNPQSIQSFTNKEQNIKIFPNPANQYVTIATSQNAIITDVKIFDICGALVIHKPFTENIDIATLQNGIYFVHIETNEGTFVKHLVVQ
ncbi:MAG: T9SS type A sorting domain-containing protein [Bacteroidales bacterium]|jgi:hypothetical protein|nr:T9SS type A sorting domain-containing protein [Bacteroidales bacterium]